MFLAALPDRLLLVLSAGDSANAAGTVALAFALHKAATPVRLPLGFAITPLVAAMMGQKGRVDEETSTGGEEPSSGEGLQEGRAG
jgi:hypothetical protein